MIVDIHDLHITLGTSDIIHGVDLAIDAGERVGLIGSSGSGKSMIARALFGLLPADARIAGSIRLGSRALAGGNGPRGSAGPGYVVTDRQFADLRGRYMGMVFQDPTRALNPVMTVAQQVGLPLYLHYDLTPAERLERVVTMLGKVGLDEDVLLKYPHELSGGQAQRVAIATALITSPRLIVADEPTTALDSITQRQIVDLLVSLVDEAGASMLFITHDFSVLSRAATRCYVLDEGAVVESASTRELLDSPHTRQARKLVETARELTLYAGQVRHG